MIHAPAPARAYLDRGKVRLMYYCRCGGVFFVLENALAHLEREARMFVADASAQEESCAPCTFTDPREISV